MDWELLVPTARRITRGLDLSFLSKVPQKPIFSLDMIRCSLGRVVAAALKISI